MRPYRRAIALPEGTVRTTPDKRVSVFDAMQAATGAKSPHDVWKRLKSQYPEVLAKCEDYKFSLCPPRAGS